MKNNHIIGTVSPVNKKKNENKQSATPLCLFVLNLNTSEVFQYAMHGDLGQNPVRGHTCPLFELQTFSGCNIILKGLHFVVRISTQVLSVFLISSASMLLVGILPK